MSKTLLMETIELRRGQPIRQIIGELFERGLTVDQVADDLGISTVTMYDWLGRLKARIVMNRSVVFPSDERPATDSLTPV